jgi:tetratricopeptide (TPR) repeat protein
MGQPDAALSEYESAIRQNPNRYRGFWGAAQAARSVGDRAKATDFLPSSSNWRRKPIASGRKSARPRPSWRASEAACRLDSSRERVKMIRSLACLGAVVGAAVVWAAVQWSHPLVVWIGAWHQTGEAFPAGETFPLCTAMGSLAADVDWAPLDPDFVAGKKALAAEDWNAAIAALKLAALREPDNADAQNYIGYAYRRLRQMEHAFAHYNKAVALNPRHRSAHQHLGEAYLLKGEISKAEQHLAALERICLIPCEEHRALKRAIAERSSS